MQLRRKLNAGSTAAHDGDINLAICAEVIGVFQEQIQHLLMETTRLVRVVEEDAVLFHARGVEVVRGAAQRHNQRVIRQLALWYQQLALLITQLCQGNGFAFAVDIHH